MIVDLSKVYSQEIIAGLVGVSQQVVSKLELRGTCNRSMSLGEWLLSYCRYQRAVAAGRAASGDDGLSKERSLLIREQRERVAMQNKVTRRELLPAILIEAVLARAGSRVAAILEGIPGMIRRRSPELSSMNIALISGEIARARNIAAALSLDDLKEVPSTPEESEKTEDKAP